MTRDTDWRSTRATTFYVAGQTTSTDFPLLNPAQAAKGGNFDAFVAKISSSGAKVLRLPISGAAATTAPPAIAVNSAGNAYVTGFTASTEFPDRQSATAWNNGGGTDTFVAKLNSAGNGLLYSTYLGGSANEDFTIPQLSAAISLWIRAGMRTSPAIQLRTIFPARRRFKPPTPAAQVTRSSPKFPTRRPLADFAVSASPASQTVNPGTPRPTTLPVTPAGRIYLQRCP